MAETDESTHSESQEAVAQSPREQLASSGEIVYYLQRFADNFRSVRSKIEEMEDEELIELYQRATEISNVSWLIRCVALGIAKARAKRGDGAVKALANAFGIGVRMAELDIAVYDKFIKDDPEFEPVLPARFYQSALRAEDPRGAIEFAIERRSENPRYPAEVFDKLMRGQIVKEPAAPGVYALVPLDAEDTGVVRHEAQTVLYGKTRIFSVNGELYMEIK